MADLLGAAATQIKYAANELRSGDQDATLAHIIKAQGFLARAAAPLAPVLTVLAADEPAEPLSSDPTVAGPQILAAVGHPVRQDAEGHLTTDDAASILGDCSPEQNRELALLGYFGQPGTTNVVGVDFSLWNQYYEFADGGARPKDPNMAIWATYLASKG